MMRMNDDTANVSGFFTNLLNSFFGFFGDAQMIA